MGRVSAIEAPDTVQAGRAFNVVVHTAGPDGCWSKDRTVVKVDGLEAAITPYDTWTNAMCIQTPVELVHTAAITFNERGTAQLTIDSRDGSTQRAILVQ